MFFILHLNMNRLHGREGSGTEFCGKWQDGCECWWKEVYEGGSTDDDEEEQTLKDQKLPVLKQGEKLPIRQCSSDNR